MDIEKIESAVRRSRIFVAVIFGIVIFSYIGWFWFIQGYKLSSDSSNWGTFGDFVGGLLNPLIAFSAFYWLTVSVLVQKSELSDTRKALTESSKAQKKQAEISLKNAQIAYKRMEFEKINAELRAEMEYLNGIIEKGSSGSGYQHVLTKEGSMSPDPRNVIQETNKNIDNIRAKQDMVLQEVQELLTNINS